MTPPQEHTFRQLLPTFIISPGTQVVLKIARALDGGDILTSFVFGLDFLISKGVLAVFGADTG